MFGWFKPKPRYQLVTDGFSWTIKRRLSINQRGEYYDFETIGYWWGVDSKYFPNCWTCKATAELWYRRLIA